MIHALIDFTVMALASGRVAYSLTQDDIFEPARRWIWWHSGPDVGSKINLFGQIVEGRNWDRFRSTPDEVARGLSKWQYESVDDNGMPPREPGWLGRLVGCFYCMSFWTSCAALAAYNVAPDLTVQICLPFALWAAANTYAAKGL